MLKPGDRGPEVLSFQQALAAHYYNPGPLDGIVGRKTLAAAQAYEYEHDLRDNDDPPLTQIRDQTLSEVHTAPLWTRGIDVSRYQGEPDFEAVKASGISFCICKAGGADGSIFYRDRTFTRNWRAIWFAELIRGAYWFHDFKDDPKEQAGAFYHMVGALESGDLPPVLDVEDRKTPIRGAAALDHLRALIGETERLFKVRPILYTSAGVLQAHKIDTLDSGLEKYPLWVPRYEVKDPAKSIPRCYQGKWTIWQVGFDNGMPGISADVDRNFFNGDVEALKALTIR